MWRNKERESLAEDVGRGSRSYFVYQSESITSPFNSLFSRWFIENQRLVQVLPSFVDQ